MFLNKLVDVAVISVFFTLAGLASATELRLVRFGPIGEEKPGLLDDQNQIHDLSAFIEDITPTSSLMKLLRRSPKSRLIRFQLFQGTLDLESRLQELAR